VARGVASRAQLESYRARLAPPTRPREACPAKPAPRLPDVRAVMMMMMIFVVLSFPTLRLVENENALQETKKFKSFAAKLIRCF